MLLALLFFCAEVVVGWPLFLGPKDLAAPGVPIISHPFTPNLQSDARFELTHSLPIQLCFQEVFPIANNTDIWNITCSVHLSFDATSRITHTGSIVLRAVEYRVAIYSEDAFQPQTDIWLKIGSVNDSCAENEVFDESADVCKLPDGFLQPDEPAQNIHFIPGRTLYYAFYLPDKLIGSASVQQFPRRNGDPGNLIFQIRYAASPTYGSYDGTSGSTATVNYPKPGQYYVAVTSSALVPSVAGFSLTVEDCTHTNQTAGPGCKRQYAIAEHETAYNGVALTGIYSYWQIAITPRNPLWVSVRSENPLDNPRIFATRGQLPRIKDKLGDVDNVDIRICNVPFCQATNIIRLNPSQAASETWYIGVLPAIGRNGTAYTVWYSTSCAPQCGLHGTCISSGPNTGLCQCEENYGGVDCSVSYHVSAENIVLYIIAGLVLLSGVCAFIAAMVTKRPKRPRS